MSPPSSLENSWIEIFRAGDYGERGRWAPEQLDQLAAAYDPRLHAAPVVLGHPADDAPAYAWVKRLRRAGHSLWAQLEKVDPLFEALLRAGRFAQRSVALYTHFPATSGPYLRHLGFLGAAPPAVKGLAPVRFADAACPAPFPVGASVTFAFDEQLAEVEMSEPKSKLESFLDHLRAFFTPSGSEGFAPETSPPPVIPLVVSLPAQARGAEGSDPESRTAGRGRVEGPAFSERLAALEQRLDVLTTSKGAPSPAFVESRSSSRAEARDARELIANFVESQRSRGRFPPAYERWGVADFMERLAECESSASCASSASFASLEAQETEEAKEAEEKATPPTLLAWFQEFLSKLPAVIEFGELAEAGAHRSPTTGHRSPLVHFAEPHRGMSIDPASVELAERAEALAAELGISYAQALTRLREESRHRVTSA